MREGFPGGPVVKDLPCNAEDTGSIPGWGAKNPHAPQWAKIIIIIIIIIKIIIIIIKRILMGH